MIEMDEIEEKSLPVPNGITDIREVVDFELSFASMFPVADRRRRRILPNRIKSALIADQALQIGMERMFQTLNDNLSI